MAYEKVSKKSSMRYNRLCVRAIDIQIFGEPHLIRKKPVSYISIRIRSGSNESTLNEYMVSLNSLELKVVSGKLRTSVILTPW